MEVWLKGVIKHFSFVDLSRKKFAFTHYGNNIVGGNIGVGETDPTMFLHNQSVSSSSSSTDSSTSTTSTIDMPFAQRYNSIRSSSSSPSANFFGNTSYCGLALSSALNS